MVHKISNIEEPSKDWSIRYRKPCLVQTFTKKKMVHLGTIFKKVLCWPNWFNKEAMSKHTKTIFFSPHLLWHHFKNICVVVVVVMRWRRVKRSKAKGWGMGRWRHRYAKYVSKYPLKEHYVVLENPFKLKDLDLQY